MNSKDTRPSFEEAMALAFVPSPPRDTPSHRLMSLHPSWKPGGELPPYTAAPPTPGSKTYQFSSYGGCVYALAALAASKVEEKGGGSKFIHSIQGVFTARGHTDRPFILDVATVSSSWSFSTLQVTVRQPTEPSSQPTGPFLDSDASIPLGETCFTCIVTFKRPLQSSPHELQHAVPPQKRFSQILATRRPDEWPPCPQADVDYVKDQFPNAGPGNLPILDMYKVDMAGHNSSLSPTSRTELIYYRPLNPIPADSVNGHIACHAFAGDRNGLIMLGNHLGYGYCLGSAASLSYSFYVHVNGEETIMRDDDWWLVEMMWPRTSAGRAMMEVRVWSPEGRHVASGYQDGIILPNSSYKL